MSTDIICININNFEFDAEVEYTEGWSKPAVTHLQPELCSEAEGEDMIINSLHLLVDVCGIETKQDIYYLIDILQDDIKEQLSD